MSSGRPRGAEVVESGAFDLCTVLLRLAAHARSMPAAGLSLTGKPPPSMSKAQYRAPKMYGMEAPVKPSVTVGGAPQPRTGVPRPTTAPAAAA